MTNKKTVKLRLRKKSEGINLLPENEREVYFEPFLPEETQKDEAEDLVKELTDMIMEVNPKNEKQTRTSLTISILILLNVTLMIFLGIFIWYFLNVGTKW